MVETLLSCRFWKPNVQNIDFISKVISFNSHNYLRISVVCKIAHAGVDPFNNVPEGPEENGKGFTSMWEAEKGLSSILQR